MAVLVTIPISIFEFAVDYERPQFKVWIDRACIVQAISDALTPWEPRIDDLETVTTGKASEQGFTIKLPLKRVSIFLAQLRANLHGRMRTGKQSTKRSPSLIQPFRRCSARAPSPSGRRRRPSRCTFRHGQFLSLSYLPLLSRPNS
jgi:hypothetical protein